MADDITIAPIGQPYPVITDEIGPAGSGRHVQVMKTGFGGDGTITFVEDAAPLPAVSRYNLPAVSRLASAPINASAAGDNTLLAGTAAQTIRAFRFWLWAAADVALKFRDGTTDFHPAITLSAGGTWVLDLDGEPWFVTSAGNAFVLNLSAAVQVSGRFYYVKS